MPDWYIRPKNLSREDEMLGCRKLLLITTEKEEANEEHQVLQHTSHEDHCNGRINDVLEDIKTVKEEVQVIRRRHKKTDNGKKLNKRQTTLRMDKTKTVMRTNLFKS